MKAFSQMALAGAVLSLCIIGNSAMMTWATLDAPSYDVLFDDAPVEFADDKTLRLDVASNDRAYLVYDDHLQIRSSYITYYDLNNSYEHEDVNYVIGAYCYTPPIPAQNATLDSVTEINRFNFYAWNGTVSVQAMQYSANRMTLEVNSTDNATLLVRPVGLSHGYEYRVLVDGDTVGWARVNSQGYFEYNYTGDWSNHTITFTLIGRVTAVPSMYLNIIQVFLYLGVFVVVSKEMLLPMRQKQMRPEEVTERLIKAAVYIVASLAIISLVFKLFIGV